MKISSKNILAVITGTALLTTTSSATNAHVRRGAKEVLAPLYPDVVDEEEQRDLEIFSRASVSESESESRLSRMEGLARVEFSRMDEARSTEDLARGNGLNEARAEDELARADMKLDARYDAARVTGDEGVEVARRDNDVVLRENPLDVPTP
mmetsp:Transcript_12139/g.22592  ORF Transcript_12139/g.22592 Transcript_12139/m.22592 type:complete len:152 (-) Transcript_12139:189-644(-)|eukprot:CAMPEP_0201866366 /NCGR_PEP_ID=MMETSP0902-20130614/985_1 /ASSEMBLY_ACC=CAM_ASM_000551 /TAXON_ID=420261 /ORGANISM="Thalassiosira antarctica, Strain CCMP982" /LENGTH=151 /DNA_ID=CAMNT_0048391333 /DNA_START=127 /DNA_END=582 /DNA_ORIENTATION=+